MLKKAMITEENKRNLKRKIERRRREKQGKRDE